jgi:PAS domain S-box-containing protein
MSGFVCDNPNQKRSEIMLFEATLPGRRSDILECLPPSLHDALDHIFPMRVVQLELWTYNFEIHPPVKVHDPVSYWSRAVMKVFQYFSDLPIRYKLFLGIASTYVLAITLGSTIIYSLVRTSIEKNIEAELQNSTSGILNMVRTSVEVSIKNHLRALAERNLEIVEHFYKEYETGNLSQDEAKRQAESLLLSQKIGETGYTYCLDSQGYVRVHPKNELVDRNVADFEFVRQQMVRKEGYMEYDWRNPGETEDRQKALYMTYFAPWDWIISVSSYRSEFNKLVNVGDFHDGILSQRFGKTGYSFVVDGEGNLVLHPKLVERNLINAKDAEGRSFIKDICAQKSGKIIYSWMNPGESVARKKLTIFNYIPELDWIVASSSYLDEFYAPLDTVRNLFIAMVILLLLLALPLTGRISSAITNPLEDLTKRFAADTPGVFSARVEKQSGDELGQLATYFNLFMEKLEQYNEKLQGEIVERKRAEARLRVSEEMFSKAFRSSPNGICILSVADGQFLNINDAFLACTGYSRAELLGKNAMEEAIFGGKDKASSLIDSIARQSRVRNFEIEVFAKSGEIRTGMLSCEPIEIRNESCLLLTIEDVTDRKHLEREIMEISDRERHKIGQDLHDDLCAHLIGVEVLSGVMNRKLENKAPEEAAFAVKIGGLVSESIKKARRLARGLCPVHLVSYGLESALRELCINTSDMSYTFCDLRCEEAVSVDDNIVATHLFRIAQEAVQNAVKHGWADRIIIDLSSQKGIVRLRVTDNGVGMQETVDTKGMGLRIMNHRAKMIGASFEIRPNPEGGTIVECSVKDTIRTEIADNEAEC